VLASTELKCLPGVSHLLDLLDRHSVRAALVTNAPPSEMHFAVDVLNLSGRFAAQVPSAECAAGKPSPEPYLEGLRRLDLDAQYCFAVEDSPAGIESATQAGLFTVGVCTSRTSEELLALGAGMTVDDFQDAALLAAIRSALV